MDPVHQQFAEELGAAVLARDFDAAHAMLAPWLQRETTPAGLRETIEARLREMMEYAGCDELTYPVGFDVDGNSSTVDDLRKERSWAPPRPIPAEVTPENFRKWACIQFLADDDVDIDAWFDLWMIMVEVDGRYGVGYFELEDPD